MSNEITAIKNSPSVPASVVLFPLAESDNNYLNQQKFVESHSLFSRSIASLFDEIEEYHELPAGWDNESGEKTDADCLDSAKRFVKLLTVKHKIPKFSAATGEEVALYWEEENFHLIIHFFKDGSLRYYVEDNGEEANGAITHFEEQIPKTLNNYIAIRV